MKSKKESVLTIHISIILALLTVFGMISFSPVVSAETYGSYSYSVSGGEATITGFSGSGDITVPSKIGGYPVRAIGVRAFFNKASLTSVVIPDSVRTIADYSFMSCSSLKSVTIGNGVTDIGFEAFMTCPKLETLTFGNGLKRIGEIAFCGCGLLKEIVFPDSVEVIGGGSFTNCPALKTVKLGKSVSEIGETAFYGCGKLNEITVDEGNGSFVSIDGVLYTKDVTEVVWCPMSKTEIDLPESVTIIGKGAFAGCGQIKNFAIPKNVTRIGATAFMEFNTLTDLIIPDSVENVGRYAFSHISTLKSVTIGKGLKGISDGLFIGCKSLTSLTIPEGVTEIGKEAFKDCSSLKTVTIPGSVTSMGDDVFGNCYALTDIYFGGTRSEWNSISANANVPEDTIIHYSYVYPEDVSTHFDESITCAATLVLKDSIDIKIYVNGVTPEIISNGCCVNYSKDGGVSYTQAFFDDAHFIEDGKFGFTVASFSANQMTKQVVFKICDGSGKDIKSLSYSIKNYCDSTLEDASSDDGLKAICKALMTYGYYAQQRFPNDASEPIIASDYAGGIDAVESFYADISGYTASAKCAAPVTGASASLGLESWTKLNFYLTGVSSIVGATVTVDGKPWNDFEVESVSNSKCRVRISGLRTVDLTSQIVLNYGDTVVSYSPMAYVKHAVDHNTYERNVCCALYLYAIAARTYFGVEEPGTQQTDVDLPSTVEIYPYNSGNVAVVNVRNETGQDCSVEVKGTYKSADGSTIKTETKTFKGLFGGDDINFIFNPGAAFVDFTCEIREINDGAPAYSDLFSFASSGTARIPGNEIGSIPDGYVQFYDKPVVRIELDAPGNLYIKATILLFDNSGNLVFIDEYKGLPGKGYIDREIPIQCEKNGNKYVLPNNLKGSLRVIVALKEVSETPFV